MCKVGYILKSYRDLGKKKFFPGISPNLPHQKESVLENKSNGYKTWTLRGSPFIFSVSLPFYGITSYEDRRLREILTSIPFTAKGSWTNCPALSFILPVLKKSGKNVSRMCHLPSNAYAFFTHFVQCCLKSGFHCLATFHKYHSYFW